MEMFFTVLMLMATLVIAYVPWREHRMKLERDGLKIRDCGLHHVLVYNPASSPVEMGEVRAQKGKAIAPRVEGLVLAPDALRRLDVSLEVNGHIHPFTVRVRRNHGRAELILIPTAQESAPRKRR